MDASVALAYVEAALNAGALAAHVRDWFRRKVSESSDRTVIAAIANLPPDASAAGVVQVVRERHAHHGGDVLLAAGSDGGGNLHVRGAHVEAGSGPLGGGNLTIRAGDGGAHGKGGDTVIVGGFYKAGDTTKR